MHELPGTLEWQILALENDSFGLQSVHFVPILLNGISSSSGLIAHFIQSTIEFHLPAIYCQLCTGLWGGGGGGLQGLGRRCLDTQELRAEQP